MNPLDELKALPVPERRGLTRTAEQNAKTYRAALAAYRTAVDQQVGLSGKSGLVQRRQIAQAHGCATAHIEAVRRAASLAHSNTLTAEDAQRLVDGTLSLTALVVAYTNR